VPFDDAALANAKYYALYYSAAWCGPCRAFTPDLVRWYKRNKSKNPEFELIFVSSDRSEEELAKYMKEDDMPWPALAYDKKASSSTLTKYSGPGIPCLVLIDDKGEVLAHSYEGKNYVGPRKALEEIEKTLKKTAAAGGTGTGGSSFDEAFKKKPAAQ
jgi:nucleoredoxin